MNAINSDKHIETDIEIKIIPAADVQTTWLDAVLKHCWGVERKSKLDRYYQADDSVSMLVQYLALCRAPRSVALQIRTHEKKDGCYVWLESGRPDYLELQHKEQSVYSREEMINFAILFNPRCLKNISHQRFCTKAEAPTRQFMEVWKSEMERIDPALAAVMEPLCAYRNGKCTEIHGCNRWKQYRQCER